MITVHQARPPYIDFEQRSVEDRNESLKLGKRCYKNVNFARVMAPGSRDVVEKIAEEWINQIKRASLDNSPTAYPITWVEQIEGKFNEWQKGNVLPESGTPIKMWAAIGPAECDTILAANVRTVEDLAILGESGLSSIGMGGRELQDKARAYLKTAESTGVLAGENNILKIKIADLERKVDALMNGSTIQNKPIDPPKRGRPPKVKE